MTTRAEEAKAIVREANDIVRGLRITHRAITDPSIVMLAEAVARLAVVVEGLCAEPKAAEAPKPEYPQDLKPWMLEALRLLRGRQQEARANVAEERLQPPYVPKASLCQIELDEVNRCISILLTAMGKARFNDGIGDEAKAKTTNPAATDRSVYVALFHGPYFLRLEACSSEKEAAAYRDGFNECSEYVDGCLNAYLLPAGEGDMRMFEPHAQVEKAMRAWADAVQSDSVALQKDGGGG
jgi:hypothetical protein